VVHETAPAFDADVLDLFREESEVDIETWNEARGSRRATIWIVVADDVPYIRSFRGEHGRWFQDLRLESHGAIHAAGRRIPVQAVPADDPESIEACSRELARKYAGDPSTPAMLTPMAVGTTLRLEPA
jgi:hypothetical protein